MNKFEQLIEYVINDDEAKARELFHNIVVEKSRAIYEEMMEDDTVEEGFGGDASAGLIDDVEVEEEGLSEEDDEMDGGDMGDAPRPVDDMGADDMGDEAQGEEDLEDRVVDLEDKLDELMAEFESLMGDEGGEDMDVDSEFGDEGDGEVDMDADLDQAEYDDEAAADVDMMENVTLKAVPKPTHGDAGANSKSPVAANSGAKGALAKPVSTGGEGGNGRPAPTAKEAIGRVGNTPAQSTQNPTPATKPHLAQATGVNNKSPLASR